MLVVTGRTLYTKVNPHQQPHAPTHPHRTPLFPQQTNVVSIVEDILKGRGQYGATFYEIGEHSPVVDIRRGVAAFNAAGADAIVSVGGGSPGRRPVRKRL